MTLAVYMIGYDLHPVRGETYDALTSAIERIGSSWWHCLDSTWLVVSDKTAIQIRDELWKHLRDDDQLLVMKYDKQSRGAAWLGFASKKGCNEWLVNNL